MLILDSITKPADQLKQSESNQRVLLDWARQFSGGWFAYATILLLALKVVWGIWDVKDIDWGDSISYYSDASMTFDRWRVNIVWSPLYSILGSLILHVSHNPYFYCIATRLLCYFGVTALVLAVMRRLMPKPLAWFAAAWWAILPINFNTLYPVHLFGAVPILVSWLVLLGHEGSRWRRGIALAIMLGAGLLVRNEQLAYAGLFAAAIIVSEVAALMQRRRSTASSPRLVWTWLKPYVIPLSIVAVLVTACYVRSTVRYPEIAAVMRYRHTNNVGQILAYGFQQRHPGVWNLNCWRDYGQLMTKQFGRPELTMTEALIRNPQIMTEHLLWNLALIPSGLQLMLFNCIGGGLTPDYIEPVRDICTATVLSALAIGFISLAAVFAALNPLTLRRWFAAHRWSATAMLCYAAVAMFVMVMQRPRASYVFCFSIEIMALTVLSLRHLVTSPSLDAWLRRCAPGLMLCAILVVPSYYAQQNAERKLLNYIEFLQPFALVIEYDHGQVLMPSYVHEIAHYLYGTNVVPFETRFIAPEQIAELSRPAANYVRILNEHNVRDVMFDQPTHLGPSAAEQAVKSAPYWRLLGLRRLPDRTLSLYSKSELYGNIDLQDRDDSRVRSHQ